MPSENTGPGSQIGPEGTSKSVKSAEKLSPQAQKEQARHQRLSQALRANLRRRKDRAREKE
jgi:hypothetical protein